MERQREATSQVLEGQAHKHNVSDVVEWHVRVLDVVVSKA